MSKVTAKVRKPIDTQHITQLVRDIKEREQVKKQLEAEIKAAQEEIKQTMKANALEEMIADVFTIRYKPVVTLIQADLRINTGSCTTHFVRRPNQ